MVSLFEWCAEGTDEDISSFGSPTGVGNSQRIVCMPATLDGMNHFTRRGRDHEHIVEFCAYASRSNACILSLLPLQAPQPASSLYTHSLSFLPDSMS